MKITGAFIAVAAFAGITSAQQTQPACSQINTRKEIRNLSSSEWNLTASVLTSMQNSGWFAWFAYLHTANFNTIHNCEMFMPFHRRFVQDFESVGKRFNSGFSLPYWDELRDYASPASSAVLTSSFLGGNGRSSDRCVSSGLQSGWTLTYPRNHCLRRQYNSGNAISRWYSPEYIQSIISRSPRMSDFRPSIEFSIHGAVHLGLAGDMTETNSPNDFAFWLHHANIDRMWSAWQNTARDRVWDIQGVDSTNRPLSLDTPIAAYNEPIRSVMQLGYGKTCYTYDNARTATRKRSIVKRSAKCTPRPAEPSREMPPLVEGVFEDVNQVPVDSVDYVQAHIVQHMPKAMLDKWFPSYNGGANATYLALPEASDEHKSDSGDEETEVYSEEYSESDDDDETNAPKYKMHNPFPLTPEWVAMHRYSAKNVHAHYRMAKEFVKDMNKAGYQSPFAKVAPVHAAD